MCLLGQAGGLDDAIVTKGAEHLFDLGITGALVAFLSVVFVRWILPRMLSQHENLITDLLKSFREEAGKAREYHEKLISTHEKMFEDERAHHRQLVDLLIAEWRQTREQLHHDASALYEACARCGIPNVWKGTMARD
jgi:hypothetical protein